jgi:hypothetical protein
MSHVPPSVPLVSCASALAPVGVTPIGLATVLLSFITLVGYPSSTWAWCHEDPDGCLGSVSLLQNFSDSPI